MAPISQNPNAGPDLNNTSSIWFWFHSCDEFNKRRENEAERFQKTAKSERVSSSSEELATNTCEKIFLNIYRIRPVSHTLEKGPA